MNKLLSLITSCTVAVFTFGQTFTLYENHFETAGDAWINSVTTGPNSWILNSCAGNGPTFPGSNAQYVTGGGVTEDCSPTGKYRYQYDNAAIPVGGAITQVEIDGTCTGTMQATFDYKTEGLLGEDYVEFVYSTDGGTNFFPIGAPLPISASWTTTTISLPALLNNSIFRVGFRFIFNNANIYGAPPAIDNFKITGADNTPPVINTCAPDKNYALNGSCMITVNNETGMVVASDNCTSVANLTIVQSPVPGAITFTQPGQTQLFTITVFDAAGNSSQCTFTGTAIDNTNPVVTCPTLTPATLNSNCEASVPDLTSSIVWSDNCYSLPSDMVFSQSPVAGTLVSSNQNITFTVTDPNNNSTSCSTLLTVADNTSPVLTCPSDVTLNANAACAVTIGDYLSGVSFIENCFFSVPVQLSQSPVSGTVINSTTVVTVTGIDEAGNSGTCTLTVTPLDVTNPGITCPASTSASAQAGCLNSLADYTGGATLTDNCSAVFNIVVTQSPAIGTNLSIGTHTITLTAEDEAGNTSNCSFSLNVTDQLDPVISCPGNQNLTTGANCDATLGNYVGLITVSDNCTSLSNLVITQSPSNGTVINSNTQITITATDQAGNSASCNFFALVIDNTDPVLTCPNSVSVAINSSCQYNVPDLEPQITGTDNCSTLANMNFTQNPSAGTLDGGLTAVLMTLTDEQGNSSTCVTMIIPDDTEAPTITCPAPPTVNNGSNCDYSLPNYGTITLVLDNCSDYTITQTPSPGTVVQAGNHTIDMLVSDVAGNTATCTFSLTIIETTAPTITCPGNISTCNPVVTYSMPAVADNCQAILAQIDASGLSSGDNFPVGATIQQYEVTDPSGNSATCSFIVQVLDYPAQADIVDDTLGLCDVTSTVVSATPHTTGSGEWTVFQGTGNFNNQFASTTGVNNLTFGTNILVYTISTVSCGSTSDTLYIIASEMPLPASTQDSLNACNSSQISLLSNTPLVGAGVWSTDDPNASIVDVNSSNTTASGMSTGYHNYIWTITNGSCPSTSDTMIVYVPAQANIDQADSAICLEDGDFYLSGSLPAPNQNSYWMYIQGNAEFDTPSSFETLISNLALGTTIIVYTMEHPNCPSTTDTITLVSSLCDGFHPVFPTVITPNLDGKNDLFVINFLEKVYPDCRVVIYNRWGSVVFESVGYENPWDGTYNGEDLPMGTYFYKIELNDADNTVYDGPISIIK